MKLLNFMRRQIQPTALRAAVDRPGPIGQRAAGRERKRSQVVPHGHHLFRPHVLVVNMKTLNLAGRQISRLRYEREWTREDLADRLQRPGWLKCFAGLEGC